MKALEALLTEEFTQSVGCYSTAKGLYLALAKNRYVVDLSSAIKSREISYDDIRAFVNRISSSFQRGVRFPFEACLAALCVSIEDLSNRFTEEFLIDLARLKISELPFASRVAGICVTNLFRLPKTLDSFVSCESEDSESKTTSITFDYFDSSELNRNSRLEEEIDECAV